MSRIIFHLSVTDEDLLEYLETASAPVGYYVIAETEVKARNFVRRFTSLRKEDEAYKKSSHQTEVKLIGPAYEGVPSGVLVSDYGY